jgi:hypothetical protein
MRARRRRDSEMQRSVERLHAVGDDVDLRRASDVYGRQLPFVHVHVVDLHADGHGVPRRADARNLRGRREQLPLRRVNFDMPEFAVVLDDGSERRVLADL